jgi:NAD(P)H-hydrate epimerase
MKIVTAAQMQMLDRRTIEEARVPGRVLMERAGQAVVAVLDRVLAPEPLSGRKMTIVCGKGNNGGDGFVIARLLRRRGIKPAVLLLAKPADLKGDALSMYRRYRRMPNAAAVRVNPSEEQLRHHLAESDVIVDALLGTGLTSSVKDHYRTAIEAINRSERPVMAVDLPSGLHADHGAVMGAAVRATWTVTMGLPKLGLYLGAGIDHAGEIHVADIGIPPSLVEAVPGDIHLIMPDEVRSLLPLRRRSAHKGTFGHVGVIAGSVGKTGAAAMAARAALRSGAGLVTVATPSGVNHTLESKLLEVMTIPMPETKAHTLARSGLDRLLLFANARSAVALGPGLTTHPETVDLVQALVPRLEKPSVLDADALNALAGRVDLLLQSKTPLILTPHPGEMARLEEQATAQSVNADRIGSAMRLARTRRVIVVLKGARTVLAHPQGSVAICPTGNAGMATAGTGDVLTGMIAGLLGQGMAPWDAARCATCLHGLAGDLAAARLGERGLVAGDVIEHIPHAFIHVARS